VDPAQPAYYVETSDEASTLRVDLWDPLTDMRMELWYTVYHEYDIITRRAVVVNSSPGAVTLRSIMSATVDLPTAKHHYTMSHLSGSWARERLLTSDRLHVGTKSIHSRRGASSHQHNPFFIISDGDYSEHSGDHYAFSLVYAGGFLGHAEMTQTGHLRLAMGIDPMTFEWNLASGDAFIAPEIALAYSHTGVGEISRQLHRLMRTRLVRGNFRDRRRPTLVNSWEAMYFDVSEDRILEDLAIPAAELGIELVVLDDGWFGERNNDRSSLGDWWPNPEKFPNGLAGVAERVRALGLEFGIWMEPEMISVDSDLYRAHPDWPLHVGERPRTESRNQLVLDLSRPDVRDFVVDAVATVLTSANISYLKWDFNRHLTEAGSAYFGAAQQGEIYHRFVLGVYDIMERLVTAFPNVLFESCSGGGGRYDPALLYYMPQVWTSDNTDAIARLKIQYGTSVAYPATTMSAHVTKSPNEQNGRTTTLATRGLVALGGVFGYELDLNVLDSQEQAQIKQQLALHDRIEDVVRTGDMYRLFSPYELDPQQPRLTSWMYVAADRQRAVLFAFNSDYYELVWNNPRVVLRGLDPAMVYELYDDVQLKRYTLPGAVLMSAGVPVIFNRDGSSLFYEIIAQSKS